MFYPLFSRSLTKAFTKDYPRNLRGGADFLIGEHLGFCAKPLPAVVVIEKTSGSDFHVLAGFLHQTKTQLNSHFHCCRALFASRIQLTASEPLQKYLAFQSTFEEKFARVSLTQAEELGVKCWPLTSKTVNAAQSLLDF